MKTDIFIVSCGKHFNHLKYALRSIKKFATGFNRTVVLVPIHDMPQMRNLISEGPENLETIDFAEWVGKGMVNHMYLIMCAEEYSNADLILHFDSDCVFTEPVTPEDYLVNGKPLLMYASFDWLCRTQQANLYMWKQATEAAIGGPVEYETMRRHPAVHYRQLYPLARQEIENHTKQPFLKYMLEQRNEFPQSFCEYVTLGIVAWRHMRDMYTWRNQETDGFPHSKLHQNWSHCDPTPENIALYQRLGIQ